MPLELPSYLNYTSVRISYRECECLQVDSYGPERRWQLETRLREDITLPGESRTYWTKCQETLMKTRQGQRFFLLKLGRDNKAAAHWSTSACTLPAPGLQPLSLALELLRQKGWKIWPWEGERLLQKHSNSSNTKQKMYHTKKIPSLSTKYTNNQTKTQRCSGLNRFEQKKINLW